MLVGAPSMLEALSLVEEGKGEITIDRISKAKKEAELATQEINEGFPLLYAQAVIALWSALEQQFVFSWLVGCKTTNKH